MDGFTLILCTYNPPIKAFTIVLSNLLSIMDSSSCNSELLIIDNNSTIRLQKQEEVANLLIDRMDVQIVTEEEPGLTYARLKGYQSSCYDWMVFVDDDNLPDGDYLNELELLSKQYSEVKCWGAGRIQVEYTDQTETKFLQTLRPLFQERNFQGVNFSCKREGADYYPLGSCLCVHREVMERYHTLIAENKITSADRTGKSLNSGGDAQIIYCSIKNGFPVGSSGRLRLRHLINSKKTRFSYLLKLKYALSSCQIKAYNEVFDDQPIQVRSVRNIDLIKAVYSHFRVNKIFSIKPSFLKLAENIGMYNAQILASRYEKPSLLYFYERLIGHK